MAEPDPTLANDWHAVVELGFLATQCRVFRPLASSSADGGMMVDYENAEPNPEPNPERMQP